MIDKVVVFAHPNFLASKSMPRFTNMIVECFKSKGIQCEVWSPQAKLYKVFAGSTFAKWAGYFDQYVLFPMWVQKKLTFHDSRVLYIFCDQALGPWVPLVSNRPHVIHCHDLMALKSALGLIEENKTSFTGRLYQRFICRGFREGRCFIPISQKTAEDLAEFGNVSPKIMKVVHNGLNYSYERLEKNVAYGILNEQELSGLEKGCLLHIGGGQWYKNTLGIVKLYAAYCNVVDFPLPLVMVSPDPKGKLLEEVNKLPDSSNIIFIQGLKVEVIQALYSYSDLLLFPSLDEGFGWPIIEAQACGCPVITTDAAPMNEVGGQSIEYLPKYSTSDENKWLQEGVTKIIKILTENDMAKENRRKLLIEWSQNFLPEIILNQYFEVYESAMKEHFESSK